MLWEVETGEHQYILVSASGLTVLAADLIEYGPDRNDHDVDRANAHNLQKLEAMAAFANALTYDIINEMCRQLRENVGIDVGKEAARDAANVPSTDKSP